MLLPNSTLVSVISQMVTPAILILAAGSLITTTMTRLGRVTDRVRGLIALGYEFRAAGNALMLGRVEEMMGELERRSRLSERALVSSYVAIGTFLACCLSIALADLFRQGLWVPIVLAVAGSAALFIATFMLVLEARIARGSISSELAYYREDAAAQAAGVPAAYVGDDR